MSIKLRHLVLMLFLIAAMSGVVSGKNLLIGGIWTTPEDKEDNQLLAEQLDAELVPTYGNIAYDIDNVIYATPSKGGILYSDFLNPLHPGTFRSVTDPSTGIIIWYWATELNGLTDERLNPSEDGISDHYDTIYAHSGGARTAVTAMLYQGVTADRLVVIDPARGPESNDDYINEIQQLLDRGVDIDYYYYKAKNILNEPTASFTWRGGAFQQSDFQQGESKGTINIYPVESAELGGLTGNDAHIQMWDYVMDREIPPAPDPISRTYAVIADEPTYTSEIPVGGTQTKHWSTANLPPGKVALSIDIRDKNGNIVPAGTKVTVKDGAGKYVQVDWSSTGQALAFGAPGDWIITVDAPGYKTNTQYVTVSSSSSTTSSRMYLQESGVNNQPPASLPLSASKFAQAGIGTPLLPSPASGTSSGDYNGGTDVSDIGPITGSTTPSNPSTVTNPPTTTKPPTIWLPPGIDWVYNPSDGKYYGTWGGSYWKYDPDAKAMLSSRYLLPGWPGYKDQWLPSGIEWGYNPSDGKYYGIWGGGYWKYDPDTKTMTSSPYPFPEVEASAAAGVGPLV